MKRLLLSALGTFAIIMTLLAGSAGMAKAADAPGSQEFATAKCGWLKANFPQNTKGVQELGASLAGVETSRITTHEYRCSKTTAEAVFDGFVVLGPNEGFGGNVTLTVPSHGAIDGSQPSCGYTYSGNTTVEGDLPEDCDDTVRASDGTVTGPRLTYYPYNDANPPKKGDKFDPGATNATSSTDSSASSTTGDETCMTGRDLAKKMKWTVMEDQTATIDNKEAGFGVVVQVETETTVPDGWIAQFDGPQLSGGDLVTPGFYTFWPPEGDCRETLAAADQ